MPDTGESIIPAAPQWVRQYRPDVIVVVGSEKLPGVLAKEGWSIPRDLGLAVLVQPNHGPLMSGLDERNEEIGAAAVDFLIGMMNRQERGVPASPQTLMINSGWIDGGTLRPRG